MGKLTKWLRWLDDNLIKILLVGYIFIIPLYPKFPIRIVSYTYIAIRMEDFYVAFLFLVFLIQLLRKKITLKKEFLFLFFSFWGAIFLSFLAGAFLQKTIILKHLGFLHTARRFEYMAVFFIAASTINSKKNFFTYLKITLVALFLVLAYGIGQKVFGFPAIQTMNPEYARGHLLFLTPEARVSSTFAGHYDLAAYIVFLIPIILGLFFYKKNIVYFLVFVLALLVLNLTASRSSFISYAVSSIAFLIFLKKPKFLILVVFLTAGMMYLSKSMSSRFFKTIQIKQIFINQKTGQVIVPERISTKELPAGTFYVKIDKDIGKTEAEKKDEQALVIEKILSEAREDASKQGKKLTSTEEAEIIASASTSFKPVNTVVSDISFATRLQVEWPRAIKAFFKNPLLGSGPSSITEATDNDYLRWLGEFGLLGTGIFLFILFRIAKKIWLFIGHKELSGVKLVYAGFLFGLVALLINASYIDVFEASKVAYTFWFVSGLFIGSLNFYKTKSQSL